MPPFSRLDYRQGCKDLTVKAIQSTQRMWWPPVAALFALVQPPLYKSDDWDKDMSQNKCIIISSELILWS